MLKVIYNREEGLKCLTDIVSFQNFRNALGLGNSEHATLSESHANIIDERVGYVGRQFWYQHAKYVVTASTKHAPAVFRFTYRLHRQKCKIVYVLRNIKDVAVSFYNHHVRLLDYEYSGTWRSYLSRFLHGKGVLFTAFARSIVVKYLVSLFLLHRNCKNYWLTVL